VGLTRQGEGRKSKVQNAEPEPLTREQLVALARRRGRDPEVRALLLEIKRLRGVVLNTYRCACRLSRYTENSDEGAALDAFIATIEEEPVIREAPRRRGELRPDSAPRWRHMSEEREAKLLARMKR
jgi:hypothetical protein